MAYPMTSSQPFPANKMPGQSLPPAMDPATMGAPRLQMPNQPQQHRQHWPRQPEQQSMMVQQPQQNYMPQQFGGGMSPGLIGQQMSAGQMSQAGMQQQVAGGPYGVPSSAMEYPVNLGPEIAQKLKALGDDGRPYYEKVCQLQQYVGFLQSSLCKYQADPAMVGFCIMC